MGEVEFFSRRVLVLFVVLWACHGAVGQQPYRSTAYKCTDAPSKTCDAFVLYRAQDGYTDVSTIANLFRANETEIARLTKVSVDASLYLGELVVIPVSCSCVNSTSTALIRYVIKNHDNFWKVSTLFYEGLATTQATVDANNDTIPTQLQIGQVVNIPIRCGCPSIAQAANGVRILMTYTLIEGDTLNLIGARFGVEPSEIQSANSLTTAQILVAQNTLVIPYRTSEPTVFATPPSPPPPIPPPLSSPPEPSQTNNKSSNSTGHYVGIGIGVCAAVLILAGFAVCVFVSLKKRRSKESQLKADRESVLATTRSRDSLGGYSLPPSTDFTPKRAPGDPLNGMWDVMDSDKPTQFDYEDIKEATNNFSHGSRIQGSVYRGVLKGEVVAIKQMKGNMSEELKILCRVHHTNLVRLVGISVTDAEQLYLVYEYAENGSLSDCLHDGIVSRNKVRTNSSSFLGWTVRVQIALDAATGLEYIHDYTKPSFVHKDVKSSNILLDSSFRAKIANFAMAKSGGDAHMTRHLAGTIGYMAPEYLEHGLVTSKADVFAFGVVLLEILSGQVAILDEADGQERCLSSMIGPVLEVEDQAASLRAWMDPVLQGNYPTHGALTLANLAKSCVERDPALRPGMKDITLTLSTLLTASLEWETSSGYVSTMLETPIEAR